MNPQRSMPWFILLTFVASIMTLTAANAEDSTPGYIIKNDGTTKYESLYEANPQNGDVLTIFDGDVPLGAGQLKYDSDTTLTIQSNSDTQRTINLAGQQMISAGAYLINLNLGNIHVTGGRVNNSGGGAIYTTGAVTIIGSGSNMFSDNSAMMSGGAISAAYVTLSGSNTFTGNKANNGSGGAIYTDRGVTLSGSNTFTGNSAGNHGGAIFTNSGVTLSGSNTFTDNEAYYGGAICAGNGNVTFSGKDSKAIFSGNKHSYNNINNDICVDNAGYNVSIRDGGSYSFGGGIVASSGLDLGAAEQDGAPDVTFATGSVTNISGALTLAGA